MKKLFIIITLLLCCVHLYAQQHDCTIKTENVTGATLYGNEENGLEGISPELLKAIILELGYEYSSNLDSLNIVIASSAAELTQKINQAIKTLQANGTIDAFYDEWAKKEEKKSYLDVFYIIIVALVAITILSLLLTYIHKTIAKRATQKVQKALLHNKELIHSVNLLIQNGSTEILMFDENTRQLSILRNGTFTPTTINLSEVEKMIHPEDVEQYKKDYQAVINGDVEMVVSRLRIFNKEADKYFYYEHVIIPAEKDENGRVNRFYYSRRDETQRMEELRYKEETINSFTMAMKSTGLIRWNYDPKKEVVRLIYSDLSEAEFTKDEALELTHPTDQKRFSDYIDNAIAGIDQDSIIVKVIIKDEGYRTCNISCTIHQNELGETYMVYGIINDLTELTHNHQRITNLQEEMKMALDAGEMSAWRYSEEDDVFTIFHGPKLIDRDMTLSQYIEYAHPEDKQILPMALKDILSGKSKNTIVKFRLNTSGKEYRWYTCSLIPVYIDGEIRYATGTRRDITDEMNSRIELQKNQMRLQSIIDKLPIPIYVKNPETQKLIYLNDDAKRLFNTENNSSIVDVFTAECIERWSDIDKNIVSNGEDYIAKEIIELCSGEVKHTFVKKILVNFNNINQILAVRVDLTEQDKLSKVQKLMSTSLPSINAFTWTIDSRNKILNYGSTVDVGDRNLDEIGTIEKCAQFIHEEDRSIFINTLLEHIDKGSGEFNMEYRIKLSQSKNYEWWETRGVSETMREGGEVYVLLYGITININTSKNNEFSLKESQEKLYSLNYQKELILKNINSGIVYLDDKLNVSQSNIEQVYGGFKSNMFSQGEKCYTGYGYDKPCTDCRAIEAMETNTPYQFVENDDERVLSIEYIPVQTKDGKKGLVIKIDNITELSNLVDDLKKMNKELTIAKNKAEESEKLKMAFLANMSHEIRTPLNAIVGFSGLLHDTLDEEEKNEYINIINKNNELLLRLIGDILDLSKIESGTVELKPEKFDISKMCSETFTTWHQRNSNLHIKFVLDNPYQSCFVTLDKNRVLQVCTNFLSNAFKYTSTGTITLGCECVDNGVKLYVKDTGIGIPKEKQHLAFERFEKLDNFAQGTGLGLPICKAIAEACGGKIGFDSIEGKGSCFWVWFPSETTITQKNEPIQPAQNSNVYQLHKKKVNNTSNANKSRTILVAEDDYSTYMLIQAILRNDKLTRVENGIEALDIAKKQQFDCILMDMRMPVMNGLDATRKIREFDIETPIIALITNTFDSDKVSAKEVGCNAFIAKPVKRNELMSLLKSVVE